MAAGTGGRAKRTRVKAIMEVNAHRVARTRGGVIGGRAREAWADHVGAVGVMVEPGGFAA